MNGGRLPSRQWRFSFFLVILCVCLSAEFGWADVKIGEKNTASAQEAVKAESKEEAKIEKPAAQYRKPNSLERAELEQLELDFAMGKISEAQYIARKLLLLKSIQLDSCELRPFNYWKF